MAVPSAKRIFRLSYPASVDDPVDGRTKSPSFSEDSASKVPPISEASSPTSPLVAIEGTSESETSSIEDIPLPRPQLRRTTSTASKKSANQSRSKLLAIESSDDDEDHHRSAFDDDDDDDQFNSHAEEEEETWEDAAEEVSPIPRRQSSSSQLTRERENSILTRLPLIPTSAHRRRGDFSVGPVASGGLAGMRRVSIYRRFHSSVIPRRRYYRRRDRKKSETLDSGNSQSGQSLMGSVESLALPDDFRNRTGSGGENKDSMDARQRIDFHNMVVRIVNSVNITGAKSSKAAAAMAASQQLQLQQQQNQLMLGDGSVDPFSTPHYEIWLGLKAWHGGVAPNQIKETLTTQRQTIVDRLKEIVDYKFNRHFEEEELDVAALDVSQDMLAEEIRALAEVNQLLEKISDIEQLYPSAKMLALDVSYYTLPVFAQRYQALCYWYNHCWTMHRQLKILAGIFQMSKQPGHGLANMPGKDAQVQSAGAWWQSVVKWLCETAALRRRDTTNELQQTPPAAKKSVPASMSVPSSMTESPDHLALSPDTPNTSGINSLTIAESPRKRSSPALFVRQLSASTYRAFVEKLLKKTAVSKLQKRLQDLVRNTPARVKRISRQASTDDELEEQSTMHQADLAAIRYSMATAMAAAATSVTTESQAGAAVVGGVNTPGPVTSTPAESGRRPNVILTHQVSFADDRMMHDEIARIGLPSLKTTYLFLARVPLDVIHECVRFRLEQYLPCERPSELSIRQLLKECKEVLLGAVRAIDQYQRLVLPLLGDSSQYNDIKRILSLERFYSDIHQLLEIYFKYLSQMLDYLAESGGSEAAVLVKKVLSDEWIFIRRIVPFIAGAEAEACSKFCLLAVNMLHSIADFMTDEVDQCLRILADPTFCSVDSAEIPALLPSVSSVDPTAEEAQEEEEEEEEGEEGEDGEEESPEVVTVRTRSPKQRLLHAYRTFKQLFRECRDRALSAAYFMRHLRKDVENTTHYIASVAMPDLIGRLENHSFVMVTTPFAAHSEFCAFVPAHLKHKQSDVIRLFNILCGNPSSSQPTSDGYLLLIATGQDTVFSWKGNTMSVSLPVQTLIALSQIRVDGLFLVASNLPQQQTKFYRRLGGFVKIHCEQTSPHQDVADCLRQMKTECLTLCERVMATIDEMTRTLLNVVQELNTEIRPDELVDIRTLLAKTLHHCFVFGFDYARSIVHLMSGPLRQQHAQAVVSLAIKWMDFVTKHCPRGRGTKPSWANQGLEFITWATETNVTSQLGAPEFSSFKDRVQMCIIHIVGGSVIRCLPEGKIVINRSASTQSLGTGIPYSSQDSFTASSGAVFAASLGLGSSSSISNMGQPARLARPPSSGYLRLTDKPVERVRRAIAQLDGKRESMLRKGRFVGHVTSVRPVDEDIHQYIKKVNFRWQKGIKIGAGQWKVYTAVNLDTGQLMAMKKITLQPNAHQQLRTIADEIQNLESIKHESLVRYYGVELHTNELLIFMEYCPGGSLAEACRAGLDESTVRRYTRKILIALSVLHDNGIVHRDIKAANIFLTAEGSLKVGDFGCAVKLSQTVTTAGDMPNMAGTIAYMSPEVIRNEQGKIGRATDIWALGCVVIEMANGQPPWHELENQYQIMYKIGMGCKPTIPPQLSAEGHDFLKRCFHEDPRLRANAPSLLEHPFVKVSTDDN